MDHDQDATESVHAQRHEAALALNVRVFDSDRAGIAQRLLRMGEADLVLGKIGAGFGWIKLDLHTTIMHIKCIFASLNAFR